MPWGFDASGYRAAYSRFLAVPGRILLTGHSHQAWPDVARDALVRSFDDAAAHVDDKWEAVLFPKMEAVGRAVLERMGFDANDAIAFGKSTHELVFRLLTCLPLRDSPRIVTTTGEFHSLDRQLRRLEEEGARVVWVPAEPRETLAERLLEAITEGTAMVAFSAVLFEDAFVLPRLGDIIARAVDVSAIPLVDAYHAFNVVPLAFGPLADRAFVTAGGYKYAEFGEGLCWLRIPPASTLRPVDTGWFADFASLSGTRRSPVSYGPKGAAFSGATFDATPFYRAEAVLAHYARFGLTASRLRAISLAQTGRLIARLDAGGLADRIVSQRADERRGGFVAIRVADADRAVARLRDKGVFVDARGNRLRLGPAPFLTDEELDRGADLVVEIVEG